MDTKIDKTKDVTSLDVLLRPQSWDDYIGQERTKQNLKIIIEAAKKRNEVCDHLLFYGQAGLGKTTIAHLIAREYGSNIRVTTGPAIEKLSDVAAILTNVEEGDILFIDEAHRLNSSIEEVLYPAMESRKLYLTVGKGAAARSITLDLPAFTLIAATTRINLLSAPFRSRFGGVFHLNYYDYADIEKIIERSAKIINFSIEPQAIKILAQASRFTPRVANRLLKRARDYAQVNDLAKIDEASAKKTLELFEIDELGLEPIDRYLLKTITDKFGGGPVGINALSAALNDDSGNIEEVYEPYLISIGFLNRTSAGRIVTEAGKGD